MKNFWKYDKIGVINNSVFDFGGVDYGKKDCKFKHR